MEPHSDPNKTKITEVKQLIRVPTWAVPRAAPMHFRHQLDCIKDYQNSEAFQKVAEGAGRYIVIGVRRCTKGPPLLPRHRCDRDEITNSMEWVEAATDGVRFGLPEYLLTFLERIGVEDIPIYDRLHGRQVMRYQAVVQLQAWERAWAMLKTPFRTQRGAYRHLYGGSNAPDLTFDMEPKFLAVNDAIAPKDIGAEIHSSIDMPTARTFIHFSECEAKQRGRCESADTLSELLLMSHL